MHAPLMFCPTGMPADLEDRARNWLFAEGYASPTVVTEITVPTYGVTLVVPAIALLTCRTRVLDLVLQCAGQGSFLVIVDPLIDLRGETTASKAQIAALFQLSQLPEKAPAFVAKPPEPAGVPFVDRIETATASKPAAKPAPEYTPDQIDKARAHAEAWGSSKLVEFGKTVGLAPREAGKLLSMFITKTN